MKKTLYILSAILVLFSSCEQDNDLKESIMIYDTDFTDLPVYSEWGYNTFGAYYDREVFISNDNKVPVKVIVTNNETSFVFTGRKGSSSYYYGDNKEMVMTFKMKDFAPASYKDILVLNDTILDLKNPAYTIILSINNVKDTVEILSGEFHFKRAQNLIVDKKQIEVILSGYFSFKARVFDEELPITVSEGRFDVGISSDNYYIY
jgi:hypothetical protein